MMDYYPYPGMLKPVQREIGTDGTIIITYFDCRSSAAIGQEVLIPDSESVTPVGTGGRLR